MLLTVLGLVLTLVESHPVWFVGPSEEYTSLLSTSSFLLQNSLQDVPSLFDFDERCVDNVVLVGSNLPDRWSPVDVIRYIETGGNLVYISGNEPPSGPILDLLREFGISFVGKIVDLFGSCETAVYHPSASAILSKEVVARRRPLNYGHAHGMVLDFGHQLWSSVSPNITAIVLDSDGNLGWTGPQTSLMCHFQSTLNSRLSVVSSSCMFSNGGLKHPANLLVAIELVKWTFGQKAMVNVETYSLYSPNANWSRDKKWFRVLDEIHVQAAVSEIVEGQKQPFASNTIRAEFVMMQPWVRLTLQPLNQTVSFAPNMDVLAKEDDPVQLYYASSRFPDRVGLFTFAITHSEPGYSFLNVQETVVLRHYQHDETPRLFWISIPYYVSMISMMIGSLAMGLVFLYHEKTKQK